MEPGTTSVEKGRGKRRARRGIIFKLVLLAVGFFALLAYLFSCFNPSRLPVGPALPPGKLAPQLVNAWQVGVLLAPDGSLWCWGDLRAPRTGLVEELTETPQRIGSGSDWCRVAASTPHAVALKTDGSLWGWGWNGYGAATQARVRERVSEPTRLGTDLDWNQIAVGAGHCLALKRDGSLWAWGLNDHGQVGDGGTNNQFTITRVGTARDWKAIAAGDFSSFALKNDGTLWRWGLAAVGGQSDDLAPRRIHSADNVAAISANSYCVLALRSDGTLWIGGQNAPAIASASVRTQAPGLIQIGKDTDWQDVYAGVQCFLARKRDNSWWFCGQCQGVPPGSSLAWPFLSAPRLASLRRLPLRFEPWALAVGSGDVFLLTKDGTLWTLKIQPDCSKTTTALTNLKVRLNRLFGILPRHPKPFDLRKFRPTATPQKIWQIKPDES